MRAPNTETMDASDRTIHLVVLRSRPTARRRPISRLRSNTERAMVLVTPQHPDHDGQGQQGQDEVEQPVQLALGLALQIIEGLNRQVGEVRQQRLDGSLEFVRGDAFRRLHIDLGVLVYAVNLYPVSRGDGDDPGPCTPFDDAHQGEGRSPDCSNSRTRVSPNANPLSSAIARLHDELSRTPD